MAHQLNLPPVAPLRQVLSSEAFVEVIRFLNGDDPSKATSLGGCVVEAALRASGTSGIAALTLTSLLDEIEIPDPEDGVAIVRVPPEVIAGLGISGDYDFEVTVTRAGVRISQLTAKRRFVAGVVGTLDAGGLIVIDRAGDWTLSLAFRSSVFGVLEPTKLEDVGVRLSLTLPGSLVPIVSASTETDTITIPDPGAGIAVCLMAQADIAGLAAGTYDVLIVTLRGSSIVALPRLTATVI